MNNLLLNKKIVKMQIASDKEALLFVTDDGQQLIVRVDADCCSHTWIESVELPALGFPFTVIACDDLDMNKEPLENEEYECLQFYGAKITTDKGDMVIDYRNSRTVIMAVVSFGPVKIIFTAVLLGKIYLTKNGKIFRTRGDNHESI